MSDPSRARSGTFPARPMAEGQRPQGFGRGNPLAHARRPYSPYEQGPGAGGWRVRPPRGRVGACVGVVSLIVSGVPICGIPKMCAPWLSTRSTLYRTRRTRAPRAYAPRGHVWGGGQIRHSMSSGGRALATCASSIVDRAGRDASFAVFSGNGQRSRHRMAARIPHAHALWCCNS